MKIMSKVKIIERNCERNVKNERNILKKLRQGYDFINLPLDLLLICCTPSKILTISI